MKEIAIEFGFKYNRRGCSCSGSPYVYRRDNYELTIYERRDMWVLTKSNTTIAKGKGIDLLLIKLKEIWD